jgi:hypothetical protein
VSVFSGPTVSSSAVVNTQALSSCGADSTDDSVEDMGKCDDSESEDEESSDEDGSDEESEEGKHWQVRRGRTHSTHTVTSPSCLWTHQGSADLRCLRDCLMHC